MLAEFGKYSALILSFICFIMAAKAYKSLKVQINL